nr:hypothetical protein Iba_chr01cCG12570 [Ipomoea batatas]
MQCSMLQQQHMQPLTTIRRMHYISYFCKVLILQSWVAMNSIHIGTRLKHVDFLLHLNLWLPFHLSVQSPLMQKNQVGKIANLKLQRLDWDHRQL